MDLYSHYNTILENIKASHKYKLGYPSSLISMLHGVYGESDIDISDSLGYPKLVDNERIGLINGGFGEVLTNNVGDPWYRSESTASHDLKVIETEVIEILGCYLGLNKEDARGYITSGGTEGNMAAIWWSKLQLSNSSAHPVTILCTKGEVHYSIKKICNIMNLNIEFIDSQPSGGMDTVKLERFLESNVNNVAIRNIVCIATVGSTITGSMDDVRTINTSLNNFKNKHSGFNYTIHIDGALYGLVLPITQPFGPIKNYFDDLNVSTMTISGHKLLGTSVCGIILTKKKFLEEAFDFNINRMEYAGNIVDITISGSRPGINALLLHNTIHSLDLHNGINKIQKLVHTNIKNTEYFFDKLVAIVGRDKVQWIPNRFNIVFPRPSMNLMIKYKLMPAPNNMCAACILTNVNTKLINTFLVEYIDDYSVSL